MGNIVLLDDLTINKIAAGEVIERPASVVKELMENSIDAGADNISVEIKNGGISYIRITDNGKGFAADDLEIAFERHATSKIRKADDLETVRTMGFRGEALASIAAIARVELVTKTEEDDVGHKIVVEGGKIISKEDTGCPKGTTITIENLFYNTPVRYKFLKKDYTESGYIEDSVTRIALVNPNIAIKLINTGKTVIQTSGNGEIKDIVYGIYGKDIAENIINVEYYFEDMVVKGVIGKPSIARSNRSNQLFFVNKRYVKDKTLTSAAEQGFKGMLGIGKYGFLILNIEIDPHKLDVNVHPSKLEVRFQEENKIFKLVYHAIKEALSKENGGLDDTKSDLESSVKNNYLEQIKKIDSEEDKDSKKEYGEHENKGISGFLKNILNNSKNEFVTDEGNLVEQVYRDKLKQEQDKLLSSMQSESTSPLNTENVEKNTESKYEFQNTTAQTKADDKFERLENNTILSKAGSQTNDVIEKADKSDPNNTINGEKTTLSSLGINSEEYKGNSNLERLVKELEANLEKLNLKPSTTINEEQSASELLTNDYKTSVESSVLQEDKEKNRVENNANQDFIEKNSSEENEEEKDKIDFESILKPEKELQANTENIKVEENVIEQNSNNMSKIENVSDGEKIQSKTQEKAENATENAHINKNKTSDNTKNKDDDKSFEEMYAKMFGIDISNRNKVEEKEESGYSVKQEDLRTVEKFSLFTSSSVYSKPVYKFIGIVFGKYIVIEYEGEMYIVNQQAANEKIIYEKVKKNYYSSDDKDSQLMLLPDIIELTTKEMGIAKDTMQLFKNAGFDLEEFGENTIKLSGVPSICIDLDTRQLFLEILNAVNTVARTAKQEIEQKLIETVAKKVSEKSKIALTASEVDNLMVQLLALPQPFVSPEGMPTAIRMSKADIEKKFSRR